MPFIYIGRTSDHIGKSIWEIVGCLKNFGEGRMIVRTKYERYPEVTFYKIVRAEPELKENGANGRVWLEQIFRGVDMGVREFSMEAVRSDFKLVHKHNESKYFDALKQLAPRKEQILPRTIPMMPLLQLFAERENHSSKELKISIQIRDKIPVRVAEESETPNVEIELGLGKPLSPQLYEDVVSF